MNLRDYLKSNRITQAEFAKRLDPPVSQGKVNHWLHGARRVSLVEAIQIERITEGKVRLQDLAQSPVKTAQPAIETIAPTGTGETDLLRAGRARRQSARRAQVAANTERDRRTKGGPPFQSLETGVA